VHVSCRHELLIVVIDALELGDVADGTYGGTTNFAGALGDVIGDGEDLFSLLIKKEMVVAKMRTAHLQSPAGSQGVEFAPRTGPGISWSTRSATEAGVIAMDSASAHSSGDP
jgi:hypothetical protein